LTIFGEKKFAFISKTNVMIKILHILAMFQVKKTPFFSLNFSAKIFKNHNIGPRVTRLGKFYPIGRSHTIGSFLEITEVARKFVQHFPAVKVAKNS
jgi:hypothetical protein